MEKFDFTDMIGKLQSEANKRNEAANKHYEALLDTIFYDFENKYHIAIEDNKKAFIKGLHDGNLAKFSNEFNDFVYTEDIVDSAIDFGVRLGYLLLNSLQHPVYK